MTYLPDDVRAGLEAAQAKKAKRKSRLRVEAGQSYYPVLRLWDDGFAVDLEDAPKLRGLVDIHDGPRHLYRLIVACDEAGERRFVRVLPPQIAPLILP